MGEFADVAGEYENIGVLAGFGVSLGRVRMPRVGCGIVEFQMNIGNLLYNKFTSALGGRHDR